MKRNYLSALLALSVLASCASDDSQRARQANEKNPADIYVQLGIQYMGLGKNDVALTNLNKALSVDPKSADAHNTIAVLYERMARPDIATNHYRRALQLAPDNPSIQNNYGQFLCGQGNYEQADTHFRAAYENPLYPKSWVALTNAGRCARLAGNASLAEDYLRQALNKNSDFSPALVEMMGVSYELNQFMSVRAFLQRYLSVASHTPETLRLGILSETRLGDDDLAEQYRDYLLSKFPESPEASALRLGRLQ